MEEILIKVADFTEYPDVRYREQDEYSGEEYYYSVINPNFIQAIADGKFLCVDYLCNLKSVYCGLCIFVS